MPGMDPAPLTQEVLHGRRTKIVDDCLRLVHHPVPKLTDQGLDKELVDGGVERDAGDHIAEGHHLAQLR